MTCPAARFSVATTRTPLTRNFTLAQTPNFRPPAERTTPRQIRARRIERQIRARKLQLAARNGIAAEFYDLDSCFGIIQRPPHGRHYALRLECLHRVLEASFRIAGKLDVVAQRQPPQLRRVKVAPDTRQGRVADFCIRRDRRKSGYRTRQVAGRDAIPLDRHARLRCGHEQRYRHPEQHHCRKLLACWYISSAAFTTLEFAS